MSRIGILGSQITLGARFYDNGVLFSPLSVNDVKIYSAKTNGTLLATITPTEVSTGFYQITWGIPLSVGASTLYDVWAWQANNTLPINTQTFSFEVIVEGTILPEPPEAVSIAACHSKPSWVHLAGLQDVDDVGNGVGLRLEWGRALSSDKTENLYYNVYYSRNRFGVFSAGPKAIVDGDSTDAYYAAVINVSPGDAYYSAIRATELSTPIKIIELEQIGSNIYAYPAVQILNDDLDAYGVTVVVESTAGYPSDGYLVVGFEIMGYTSLDATNFYVDVLGRGEFGTMATKHYIGEGVQLFWGFEDGNTNIVQADADWFYTNGVPRNVNAIGQPNVNEDGYRAALTDDLTTDLAASEISVEDFSSYDYNSYHRPSMQDLLSGQCVNSYSGGEFNGSRGLNLQDRLLSQLDMLLQTSGEPVIILRRKWEGKRCRCISLRKEHQRVRCPYCFDTGFDGGFDRLFNKRAISESFTNSEGMFMMRISPWTDDLTLTVDQGLSETDEITMWTLTIPNLKDRDIVVRFEQGGLEEFRYEVLSVVRNKLLFNQTGRTDVKMRRLDRTDMLYEYPTHDSTKFLII